MKRVLVIDDDLQLQKLLKRWLDNDGYEVEAASNGNAGLEIQRKMPVDLVVTDIFMPEKEGTEVLMAMQSEFPQTKVIVISGGGGVQGIDYLKLAGLLGAARVLKKPFEKQEFMAVVYENMV